MSTFEIQANVPIPQSGRATRYPFRAMEVGESFLVPVTPMDDRKLVRIRLNSAAVAAGRRLKRKFVTRAVPEEHGYRCWRDK